MFYNSVKNEGFIRKGSKIDSKTEKSKKKEKKQKYIKEKEVAERLPVA